MIVYLTVCSKHGSCVQFYTTTGTASPMNSYILISAESEQQSEEEADTDQLGSRRLATEVFNAVCYFGG